MNIMLNAKLNAYSKISPSDYWIDQVKQYIDDRLIEKQDVLTFDNRPIVNSINPVTSDGIRKYKNYKNGAIPTKIYVYEYLVTETYIGWTYAGYDIVFYLYEKNAASNMPSGPYRFVWNKNNIIQIISTNNITYAEIINVTKNATDIVPISFSEDIDTLTANFNLLNTIDQGDLYFIKLHCISNIDARNNPNIY